MVNGKYFLSLHQIMVIRRKIYNLRTAPQRWWHRHGFGIHSPHDYELIRDVLFEKHAYYAYKDLHLNDPWSRQLYRIRLWNPTVQIIHTQEEYETCCAQATDHTCLIIENISNQNLSLWKHILKDPKARITFDMRNRGLVLFNTKRIKQNYLL